VSGSTGSGFPWGNLSGRTSGYSAIISSSSCAAISGSITGFQSVTKRTTCRSWLEEALSDLIRPGRIRPCVGDPVPEVSKYWSNQKLELLEGHFDFRKQKKKNKKRMKLTLCPSNLRYPWYLSTKRFHDTAAFVKLSEIMNDLKYTISSTRLFMDCGR